MPPQKSKWLKWEFWPMWLFYLPVYVVYLGYSLRAWSMPFFTAANPSIELGGFVDYSKWGVLKRIHSNYLPVGHIFSKEEKNHVTNWLKEVNLSFPLIFKPDRGERGFGVEKINSEQQMNAYLQKVDRDFIVQEYIDYPLEFGVMYSRIPGEKTGEIHSLVQKEFLSVVGDGKSTLIELFQKNERTQFHFDLVTSLFKNELHTILPKDERKELVAIGNHARGTTFLDATHLINEQLHTTFDKIALPIEGFYFGRFDLRVPTLDDLYKGENIKIMELNGVNSEPAHMYDPNMPLLKAYKIMFHHWSIIYKISSINHKNGVPYASLWETYSRLKRHVKSKD